MTHRSKKRSICARSSAARMRASSSSPPLHRWMDWAMTAIVSRMLASRTSATSGSIATAWSMASRLARLVS